MQSNQPTAPASARPSLSGRRLTAAEMQDRFTVQQHFVASDPAGVQFDFTFDPNGEFGVSRLEWEPRPRRQPSYSAGRFRILSDHDNICLSMNNPALDYLQGCYWFYDEGGRYVMRAVANAYSLTFPISAL